MIETLISSKTRIKLLLKFFLNSSNTAYLRRLENEFGESSNAIRVELNRLEEAGMLQSFSKGNKKFFQANTEHPLYNEIHQIIRKYVGLDRITENVVQRLGDVKKVYLAGEFARGVNSDIIDLIFIGEVDQAYLTQLISKTEDLVRRRIRYLIYSTQEAFAESWGAREPQPFLIWASDNGEES